MKRVGVIVVAETKDGMERVDKLSVGMTWGAVGNLLWQPIVSRRFAKKFLLVGAKAFALAQALDTIYDDLTEEQKAKVSEITQKEMSR